MSFSFSAKGDNRAAFVDAANDAASKAIRDVDAWPLPQAEPLDADATQGERDAHAAAHTAKGVTAEGKARAAKAAIQKAHDMVLKLAGNEPGENAIQASVSGHTNDDLSWNISVQFGSTVPAPEDKPAVVTEVKATPPEQRSSSADAGQPGAGESSPTPPSSGQPGAGAPTSGGEKSAGDTAAKSQQP